MSLPSEFPLKEAFTALTLTVTDALVDIAELWMLNYKYQFYQYYYCALMHLSDRSPDNHDGMVKKRTGIS